MSTLGVIAAVSSSASMASGFAMWGDAWQGSAFALNLFKCSIAGAAFLVCAGFAANLHGSALFGTGGQSLVSFPSILALIISSICGILIGDNAWLAALLRIGPTRVLLVDAMRPFAGAIAGWLVLGELLSPRLFFGLMVSVTGIIFVAVLPKETDETSEEFNSRQKALRRREWRSRLTSRFTNLYSDHQYDGNGDPSSPKVAEVELGSPTTPNPLLAEKWSDLAWRSHAAAEWRSPPPSANSESELEIASCEGSPNNPDESGLEFTRRVLLRLRLHSQRVLNSDEVDNSTENEEFSEGQFGEQSVEQSDSGSEYSEGESSVMRVDSDEVEMRIADAVSAVLAKCVLPEFDSDDSIELDDLEASVPSVDLGAARNSWSFQPNPTHEPLAQTDSPITPEFDRMLASRTSSKHVTKEQPSKEDLQQSLRLAASAMAAYRAAKRPPLTLKSLEDTEANSFRLGYLFAISNILLDAVAAVLMRYYATMLTPLEIGAVRFGFSALIMGIISICAILYTRWNQRGQHGGRWHVIGSEEHDVESGLELVSQHSSKNKKFQREQECTSESSNGMPWYALPSFGQMTTRQWILSYAGVALVTFNTPLLSTYSLFHLPLGMWMTLTSLTPICSVLVDWIRLRRPPSLQQASGSVLAVVGIAIIATSAE